ncbi:nucleotide-diphospho-sugar transferase [Absidia repens]|uniref:Nucleotide-diphospho-sugar transferase n=1 Tax=Absidia repens TaxID=90262 RepID=A0A1X2J2X6_9FUNG|nr:nucleotide-diphospho-sugar transferase [Absidia repens]
MSHHLAPPSPPYRYADQQQETTNGAEPGLSPIDQSLGSNYWHQNRRPVQLNKDIPDNKRAKGVIVILARNSNLHGVRASLRQFEARINHRFHYPYVFLNEEPFTDEFKHYVNLLISSTAQYGLIPRQILDQHRVGPPTGHVPTWWGYPDHIDQEKAKLKREEMAALESPPPYADSESYRHMCRFQSGFFFRHPLLDGYDYYWRVEPDVDFYCDVDYDVFQLMKDKGFKYGWNIAIQEIPETIQTLWAATRRFLQRFPAYGVFDSEQSLLTWIMKFDENQIDDYNGCHFWSNFEIGSLDFFRSKPYLDFFDHLDQEGGFFYERWGDAPVHSIAAALLLKKSEIHFFNDIGYNHPPIAHCPTESYLQEKCHCDPAINIDWKDGSCAIPYKDIDPHFVWDEFTYYQETNPFRLKNDFV